MPSKAKVWHPEDIKAAVRKKRWTLTALAKANGLSESACRVAFIKPFPAANRAIAKIVGEPLNVLWPDWFDKSGNRKPSVSGNKDSDQRSRGHRQKPVAK